MRVKDDVDRLVKEVSARLGPIDALVNNAGLVTVGPVEAMEVRDFADAMDTNSGVRSTRSGRSSPRCGGAARAHREYRVDRGHGRHAPSPALQREQVRAGRPLGRPSRAELARDGILVTTICPGLMRTGSPRHAFFKGRPRAEHAWFSISASLPGLSMDVERAAREVVEALSTGGRTRAPLPAKLGALAHGLFPGFTAEILGLVNRCLPSPQVTREMFD
jgi:NAD(P)-dependent dehydrogenase (short-subunit alcohol dehydrogenase family)